MFIYWFRPLVENLAEGYINCIRVLKEDNLKFYVLQYYEDFLRIALEREEYHAAATVFREAADYARRVGLIYDRGYMKRAAETWWKAAEKNERDGGPVEITENAYLAAIDAYNSVGDFFHVRESYKQLAKLGARREEAEALRRRGRALRRGVAGGDRRRAVPRLPAPAARLSRDLVPRPRRVGARRRSPRGLRQHHRRRALSNSALSYLSILLAFFHGHQYSPTGAWTAGADAAPTRGRHQRGGGHAGQVDGRGLHGGGLGGHLGLSTGRPAPWR